MPGHQRNLQSLSESVGQPARSGARNWKESDETMEEQSRPTASSAETNGMPKGGLAIGNVTEAMLDGLPEQGASVSDASQYTWPGVLRFMQLEWRQNARARLEQEIEAEKLKVGSIVHQWNGEADRCGVEQDRRARGRQSGTEGRER